MATARKSFEAILLDRSWVSAQDLDKARQRKKPGQELADVLVEMGALEPQRLARALAQEYRLPFQAHIDENSLDSKLVAKIPINYAKKNRLLPLSSVDGTVTVAIADPANFEPLDDLRILFGAPIQALVAPAEVIAEAINRAYDQASATSAEDLMIDLAGRAARRGRQRTRVGAAGLARVRRFGADYQARQRHPVAGGQGPRERYSHRSVRKGNGGALPRGRHDVRRAVAAQAFSAGDHLARQGHGGPQYRGEAAAAGRTHPAAHRRPRYRFARLVDTDRVRRAHRAATARSRAGGRSNQPRPSWFLRGQPAAPRPADSAEPRDHSGDRTDRLGQIDDAVRVPVAESILPKKTSSRSRIRSSTSCAASARCR